MTDEQRKHLGEARIAKDRASVWAEKADKVGFVILAGFWREVENMLKIGIQMQERALRDNSLLTQTSQTYLENTATGRLFDNGEQGTKKTES
jgi:hypothetical protein